jgi:hypothetical protein
MPVLIRCPDCQKLLKVKEELAGKKVKCPNCGIAVRVPVNEPEVVGVDEVIDLPTDAASRPSAKDIPLSAAEVVLPNAPSRPTVKPIPDANQKVSRPGGVHRDYSERDRLDGPEHPSVQRVPFPVVVTLAGSIWIIFGIIVILATFAQLAMLAFALAVAPPPTPPPPVRPGQPAPIPQNPSTFANLTTQDYCSLGCVAGMLFFGAVFLNVGIQSVRGKAAGTLGNGLGSLGFGLIYGGLGILLLLAGAVGSVGNVTTPGMSAGSVAALIIGGVYVLAGGLLLLAGLLALIGYSPYMAWRKAEREARQQMRR